MTTASVPYRPEFIGIRGLMFAWPRLGPITLYVAEAGPRTGPLVMLLHGFPEFWFGWRHQIGALANAGFHVVAPDQRGYNFSDKPKGVGAYNLDLLAGDIINLADCFGARTFSLVGHDWGASVAWWVGQKHPERLRRLAILNAPHPALWKRAMNEDPEQRALSRYVRLLGIPLIPELAIRAGRYASLVDALRDSTRALSDTEITFYRQAWARPGALTAMINWYRALLRTNFERPAPHSIEVPTRIIWGAKDKYATLKLAEESAGLGTGTELTVLPNATHWVQHDEAERVNAMLLEFLN